MEQSNREALRSYRFYFFDHDNHIAKSHEIDSSSDSEACELAGMMLAEQSRYPSVEVWERARMVCRHPSPQPHIRQSE